MMSVDDPDAVHREGAVPAVVESSTYSRAIYSYFVRKTYYTAKLNCTVSRSSEECLHQQQQECDPLTSVY